MLHTVALLTLMVATGVPADAPATAISPDAVPALATAPAAEAVIPIEGMAPALPQAEPISLASPSEPVALGAGLVDRALLEADPCTEGEWWMLPFKQCCDWGLAYWIALQCVDGQWVHQYTYCDWASYCQ